MPSAKPVLVETATVAFVNEPEGRGPGSIKDTKGRYWKVWPDKLEEIGFVAKTTYALSYKEEEYRGKVSRTVIGAQPVDTSRNGSPPKSTSTNESKDSFDRSTNTYVSELVSRNPEFALALANGDVRKGVQILRTARLIWAEYLKPVPEAKTPPENAPADYDDQIPY